MPHLALGGGDEYIRISDGAVVGKDDLVSGERYVLRNGWETDLVFENKSNFTISFLLIFWRDDGSRLIEPIHSFGSFGTYAGLPIIGSVTLPLLQKTAAATTLTFPSREGLGGWVKADIYPNTGGNGIPPGGVLDVGVSLRYRYVRDGVVLSETFVRSWDAEDLPRKYSVYYDNLTSSPLKRTGIGLAFTNPTDQWNEVNVSLPPGSFSISIPPRSMKTGMLDDFGIALPLDSAGLMTVESVNGLQLGFVALHVNLNHEGFTVSSIDGAAPKEGVPNSVAGWDGGLSSYYATFSL